MGLNPDYIDQLITGEEIPLRSQTFSPDTIHSVLRYGADIGSTVIQHGRISRGADLARQLIDNKEKSNQSFHSGTVIIADEMEKSRGRFSRAWHAPDGGLWLTLVLVNTLLPESNLLLPMAAGVACCETLLHYGVDARVKWVNDVLVDGRKITGILTETHRGTLSGEEYILIGIGMNINNETFPAELNGQAISLKTCLGERVDLQETGARLLAKLRWNIGLLYYEEVRGLEIYGGAADRQNSSDVSYCSADHLLLARYRKLSDTFNRRVLFGFDVQNNPQFEAKAIGLDKTGGLILEMVDSSKTVQQSGEIIYLD